MTEYKIVFDESTFAEVIKRQTHWLKDNILFETALYDYANDERDDLGGFWIILKQELKKASQHKTDRAIFISELLVYLGEKRDIIQSDYENDAPTNVLLDDVTHFLVRELEKAQVGIDKNAFTLEEIKIIKNKVNTIIKKLDKLAMGQEVVFNRVDELKNDYKDILNSFGLGKKPFYQRFAGIVATYAGEKGADELLQQLRPLLKEVVQQSIRMIG
ncbi:hypothetical protein ACFGVS_03230 [Mucilaginibacter sp. AW1-7]|uniref:hypothetical protein n=1 Tax=Mucilaginibacter sp. AW1-7 TaxID=3349874 RepID=UPI003F739FE0